MLGLKLIHLDKRRPTLNKHEIQWHVMKRQSSNFTGKSIACISAQEKHYQWSTLLVLSMDKLLVRQLPYYWPFVRGIHSWPVDSLHQGLVLQGLWFYLQSCCLWLETAWHSCDVTLINFIIFLSYLQPAVSWQPFYAVTAWGLMLL